MTPADLRSALQLYLVADPDQCPSDLVVAVDAALAGGVTAVQLRSKHLTDRDTVALGRQLRCLTTDHRAPLLVNDRVDIALAIGADGVHLGVTDLSPADARAISPSGFIIGYSPDDASDGAGAVADYLGIGPVYGTSSKSDAGDALGLEAFGSRVFESPVPVVGIGGITAGNAAPVMGAGAVGVAVISAILREPDPENAARRLRAAIDTPR